MLRYLLIAALEELHHAPDAPIFYLLEPIYCYEEEKKIVMKAKKDIFPNAR